MERAIPSAFAGNAGEFFVLAELTRRGWTAALTARNNRAYDILAKRDDEFAAIRVKTKTSAFTLFQWNAKPNGEVFLEMTQEGDFCVLVDIPEEANESPDYYIVPTPVIDKWLKGDFHAWVTTPGVRGQARDAENKRRLFYVDDDATKLGHGYQQKLAPYKGAWEMLAKRQHAFDQLALLAQQAGLSVDSLVALADSGMNGRQLIEHLVGLHKGVNKTLKP
ncbi:MAG: hypothetical protein LAN71_05395 [Acidobacteriia bacterium]|nr:hypothetical protein [Terriglobia bacterium]